MKPKHRRRRTNPYYWAVMLFSILFLFVGWKLATSNNPFFAGNTMTETYYRARVLSVGEPRQEIQDNGAYTREATIITLRIRLLEGAMDGEEVELDYEPQEYASYKTYRYRRGERILVTFDFDENGEVVWRAVDHVREGWIAFMVLFFLFLLVLFGRRKGLNTVVSLIFTTGAIFFIMIPSIIKGTNIYFISLLISSFIVVMTLGIVIGLTPKSVAAAIGCISGVGLAGLLTVFMQMTMRISGLVSEESSFVMYINPENPIELRGVIFAAILVGALGATMDVAMSIASSLDELLLHRPDLSNRELFASGMNIGRDIMGTMSNTLILAYVGGCLHTVLLMLAYNGTLGNIINREQVAVEVLQAVAGSIGILSAVPATALATVALRRRFGQHNRRVRRPVRQQESSAPGEELLERNDGTPG